MLGGWAPLLYRKYLGSLPIFQAIFHLYRPFLWKGVPQLTPGFFLTYENEPWLLTTYNHGMIFQARGGNQT